MSQESETRFKTQSETVDADESRYSKLKHSPQVPANRDKEENTVSMTRLAPTQKPVHPMVPDIEPKTRSWTPMHLIAVALWLIYVSLGFYLTLHLHYYAGDAVSRVANAYYVLYGRNPHLGAIGFIWNPLPSLLELPIVSLYPLVPAVVTKGLAGICVSALFGAWGAVHLHRILTNFSVPKPWNYIITLIFALNPLIALYGANGMSDIMLLSCLLGTYSGVLDFLTTHALRRLVSAGIWMALGLGMRYEAVPFGALVIIGLMAAQWKTTKPEIWAGSAMILGAPIVFAGGLWIYFNWAIMKNPVYFLNSGIRIFVWNIRVGTFCYVIVSSEKHVGCEPHLSSFGIQTGQDRSLFKTRPFPAIPN